MPVRALLPADLDESWSLLTAPTPLARVSGWDSPMAGVRGGFRQPVIEERVDRERLVIRWPTSIGAVVDTVEVAEHDQGTALTWSLAGDPPARDYDLDDVAYVRAWRLHDILAQRPWTDPQDYAAPVRRRITRSLHIQAPPERVWQVLTQPESVATWLSGAVGKLELHEGGTFDTGWRSPDGLQTGPGRVLKLQEHRLLETTWCLWGSDPTDSVLSLLLDGRGGGTRLTLHHGPWPDDWDACGYALGWLCCLLTIRSLAEDNPAVQP